MLTQDAAPRPYSTAYERNVHRAWWWYARAVRVLRGRRAADAFATKGYVVGTLTPETLDAVRTALASAGRMALEANDYLPGFRCSEKVVQKPKIGRMLNAGHRYYRLDEPQRAAFARVLREMAAPIASAIGSPWRALNLRVLETLPSAELAGPNQWHGDGFPPDILKVMLYITAPGDESGTTEFQHPDGSTAAISGPAGTWVLFKNSVVIHRGIPPRSAPRVAAELTLAPSFAFGLEPLVAGLNATYPEYPWSLNPVLRAASRVSARTPQPRDAVAAAPARKPAAAVESAAAADPKAERARMKAARAAQKQAKAAGTKKVKKGDSGWARLRRRSAVAAVLAANRVVPPVGLNIGGGPEFARFRWRNLEGARGPANPHPFRLTPTCTFPLRSASVPTVYTSHCIEHLDDDTVARVMAEARRVVRADGRLVIKIPDFDLVLDRWRAADDGFFVDDRWGLRRIKSTWPTLGVDDTIDARAAMIFCGVWNGAYGDHFAGVRSGRQGAYHGPAPAPRAQLQTLRDSPSPHEIASTLRRSVLAMPGEWTFNHQNAWSRSELQAVLDAAGFDVITFDAAEVLALAADVPGITAARSESLYCLARPRA